MATTLEEAMSHMSHRFELRSSLCYNHKQTLLARRCIVQLVEFPASLLFSSAKPRKLTPNKRAAAQNTNSASFHFKQNLVSNPERRVE